MKQVVSLFHKMSLSFSRTWGFGASVAVVVVATFSAIFIDAYYRACEKTQETLNEQAAKVSSALIETESLARSFQAFFQSSIRTVDPDEFRIVVEQAIRNYPYIAKINFAYRINAADRSSFETEMEETGRIGFRVFSRSANGFTRSPARGEGQLYPVVFSEPLEAFGSVDVGFDISSNEVFVDVLNKAVVTDSVLGTVLTIPTVARNFDDFAIEVVVPVYAGKERLTLAERPGKNVGVFLIVLDPKKLPLGNQHDFVKLMYTKSNSESVDLVKKSSLEVSEQHSWIATERKVDFLYFGKQFRVSVRRGFQVVDFEFSTFLISSSIAILLIFGLILLEERKKEVLFKNLLLEKRVRELSEREIALTEARKKAEAANEAKIRFLGIMSHEIRTPLNAMFGFVDLLRYECGLTGASAQYLQQLEASASNLLGILDSIFDYARDQSLGVFLLEKAFDLRSICSQCLELHRVRRDGNNVVLSLVVDSDCPAELIGDPFRLSQVLHTLLSNAVKFTKLGTVELRVSVLESSAESRTLCFCVSDTGTGIAEEFLKQAFAPFSQESDALNRDFGGVGLGLAIASSVVTAMQGNIKVSSEKSVGTRVEVILPFHVSA